MLNHFTEIVLTAIFAFLALNLLDFSFEILPMTSWWTNRFVFFKQMGRFFSKMSSSSATTDAKQSLKTLTNAKCRNTDYPRSQISRFPVPDKYIKWEIGFTDYQPKCYTADSIKGQPWADPEKLSEVSVWNTVDTASKIDRTSHEGQYQIDATDGVPLNPMGRTGIKGRGCLGRWGPNHAADPIVTRWKLGASGEKNTHSNSGKPILQFIAILRKDSQEWAIPGGMVDPGELVTATLRREFGEEALNSLEVEEEHRKALEEKIDNFFSHGFEIYRGYVDDPRNTDNAWMETVAYNFHDDIGDCVGRFKLHAGDDAVGVKWMDIDHSVKLYASHADMIKKVAEHHDAHW